jgi:hypothetical protein
MGSSNGAKATFTGGEDSLRFEHVGSELDRSHSKNSNGGQGDPDHVVGHDILAIARQELLDQLSFVQDYIGFCRQFTAIGDDPGRDYCLKKAAAHMRAAISLRNHLHLVEDDGEAGQ